MTAKPWMIGGALIALTIIGYIYSLIATNPSEEAVNAAAKPVEVIDASRFFTQTSKITSKEENGSLPIQLPDQEPKDNPFSNLE